jgi:hypothetical protein
MCGGGDLIPVEFAETVDSMRDALDMKAGIDAWQIVNGSSGGMRGLGSRIQPVTRSWESFTLRCSLPSGFETELDKRMRAVFRPSEGWLMPHWTVQAYVTAYGRDVDVFAVGVVDTRSLIHHVCECRETRGKCSQTRSNRSDGNKFIPVFWEHLAECGVPIKVWRPRPEPTEQLAMWG